MERKDIEKLMKSNISLQYDFIYKSIFSNNPDLLIDLLEAILEIKIKGIDIIQDYSLDKFHKEEKQGVLDIKATLSTGEIVNIEMQIRNHHNTFERMQYYASKLYAKEIKSGGLYKSAKPIICISILDYVLYKNENHYLGKSETYFIKTDENNIRYMELMEKNLITYITIELPIFKKMKHDTKSRLEQWLTIISKGNIAEIEKSMTYNEKIKKALDELKKVESTPEVLSQIEKLEDDLRNSNDALLYAKTEGFNQGIEESKIQIIKQLYKKQFPVEQISEMLEIAKEKVEYFLKK